MARPCPRIPTLKLLAMSAVRRRSTPCSGPASGPNPPPNALLKLGQRFKPRLDLTMNWGYSSPHGTAQKAPAMAHRRGLLLRDACCRGLPSRRQSAVLQLVQLRTGAEAACQAETSG